jgi:hypothetical protein
MSIVLVVQCLLNLNFDYCCYYKKACGNVNPCGNENACGNEVLISRKMDGISLIYPTGIAKKKIKS